MLLMLKMRADDEKKRMDRTEGETASFIDDSVAAARRSGRCIPLERHQVGGKNDGCACRNYFFIFYYLKENTPYYSTILDLTASPAWDRRRRCVEKGMYFF